MELILFIIRIIGIPVRIFSHIVPMMTWLAIISSAWGAHIALADVLMIIEGKQGGEPFSCSS